MSPTGTSNRRWACETWAKAIRFSDFFSFVLYSPTRAGAGFPIKDLQFGREVAFPYIGRSYRCARVLDEHHGRGFVAGKDIGSIVPSRAGTPGFAHSPAGK